MIHAFWETHIAPIASLTGATDFLEIGAEYGIGTEQLMAYCHQGKGSLTVIDPAPLFNAAPLRQKYDQCQFHLYENLSLEVIPSVSGFDIGLIDGDHNWYTVLHELKLLEEKYADKPDQFPILFLHDIGWPYGRRDLYYNPETIPSAHRQEYAQAGLVLGQSALSDGCYYNCGLHNAVHEGGAKNGVLTAVEDFIKGSTIKFDWLEFPTLHGLGILVSEERKRASNVLSDFLNKLRLTPEAYQQMWESEKRRLQQLIKDEHERIAIEKNAGRRFHILSRFKAKKR